MVREVLGGAGPLRVLALMDTYRVSGPCLGLFELIEQIPDGGPQFVVGFFLRDPDKSSPACEEASRRGIPLALFREKYRYDPRPILQAMRVVKTHNISILQSHGYKSGAVAWILKRLTGLPWVAFVHGYTAEDRRIAIYNSLDRWLIKGADRVIGVSEATKRLLQRAGLPESRLRVVHNGIDLQRRGAGTEGAQLRRLWQNEPDSLLIGVIGRLSPEKGQAVFLDALRITVQTFPRIKAVLIGEGPERPALEGSVKAAGLEKYVRFAGYQTDMSSVYAALDLVVIPSLSEGLPNVLLEAFLHGKAVIATKVGGIPEVMQNRLSAFLTEPGDKNALAERIIRLVDDTRLREEIGLLGARRVKEYFSSSRRVESVLDVYHELQILGGHVDPPRKIRVLSNVPLMRSDNAESIEYVYLGKKLEGLLSGFRLVYHVIRSDRYDVIFLNEATPETLVVCFLKYVWPFHRKPLISADVILRMPKTNLQCLVASIKRLLLEQVSLFLLYQKDISGYTQFYGVQAGKVAYVPFKVNAIEIISRQEPVDGEYLFSGGVSMRDWNTFREATRGIDIPIVILTPLRLDGFDTNATFVHDDGSIESWITHIANSKFVVLPICSTSIAPSGISTYLVAMALKKCVIITEGPSTKGILNSQNSVIVPPGDADALRDAIQHVNSAREFRQQVAEGGFKYAMSLGDTTRLYGDFIEHILKVARN